MLSICLSVVSSCFLISTYSKGSNSKRFVAFSVRESHILPQLESVLTYNSAFPTSPVKLPSDDNTEIHTVLSHSLSTLKARKKYIS